MLLNCSSIARPEDVKAVSSIQYLALLHRSPPPILPRISNQAPNAGIGSSKTQNGIIVGLLRFLRWRRSTKTAMFCCIDCCIVSQENSLTIEGVIIILYMHVHTRTCTLHCNYLNVEYYNLPNQLKLYRMSCYVKLRHVCNSIIGLI